MLAGIGAGALVLGFTATPAHAVAPQPWRVVQTTGLPGDDLVHDIAVAPSGSTWAVGNRWVSGRVQPIVQRLSGGTWRPATAPVTRSGLAVVDASSSRNVWAFGDEKDGTAVRWNGVRWTAANIGGTFRARDAEAISSSNVWAVDGSATARHWTGRKWTSVRLPARAQALHAVSARDIWAAGTKGTKAAAMHWNGRTWRVVKTAELPRPGTDATTEFRDVTVSGKSVWLTGGASWSCGIDGDDVCYRTLALRRTGRAWKSFASTTTSAGLYTAVAADGSGGAWLLLGGWNPSFVHAVGNRLTTVPAPRPSGHDVSLTALENRPGTRTLWSAGAAYPQGDPNDPTGNGVYLRTG